MDTSRLLEIQKSNENIPVYFNNHIVWINHINTKQEIAKIIDLDILEIYVVPIRKLSEGNNNL